MAENKSTLEVFQEAKSKLLDDYKAKVAEVNAMKKELVKLGVIVEETTDEKPKVKKARKPKVTLNDEAVIAFIGEEEKTPKDVVSKFGCSSQTAVKVLKKLAHSKKLQFRHEDPKNPKSKLLFKAKK